MVGMSGGIDSSQFTAYMLQKEGYEVEGIYLKLHNRTDGYHGVKSRIYRWRYKIFRYKILYSRLSRKIYKDVYNYFVNSYLEGTSQSMRKM